MKILTKKHLSSFLDYDNHKFVIEEENKKCGLHAFVSIHNNNLGPATGGTRIYHYKGIEEALTDVLRLSKAMTYKCAISGVRHGGGKGVIMINDAKGKSRELLEAYADFINKVNEKVCNFTTGEDVGINEDDIEVMSKKSKYIVGARDKAGDPSPFAALSCFYSIKKASNIFLNRKNLEKVKVSVKGVGKVGSALTKYLHKDGCKLTIADIDPNAFSKLNSGYKIRVENYKRIFSLKTDVYSPCAMGNEFTKSNIKNLNCKVICGAANNQLSDNSIGKLLHDRGILYVPDYIANCGGLINVVDQLNKGGYRKERVIKRIKKTVDLLDEILRTSIDKNIPTNLVADKKSKEIVYG